MSAHPLRPLRRDDAGVSTVLGAVLVLGLFVITLVAVQTQYVPVWDKQREQDLALLLGNQVGTLKADLDRLAGNKTSIPLSDPISLKPQQGFTFLQGSGLAGTVAFTPGTGTGFQVASNQLTLQQSGGVTLYGLSEDWTSLLPGQTITDVTNILHLRLRVNDPTDTDGSMTFTIRTPGGLCQGQLTILVQTLVGSDRDVQASVYGPATPLAASCNPTAITQRNSDAKKQTAPAFYYIDALDFDLKFAPVLAVASYPATLTLTTTGTFPTTPVSSSASIVYDQTGGVRVGGGGLVIPNYSSSAAAGALKVVRNNQQVPSQTYTLEYGAVFLEQPDGAAMVVPPLFSVASSATQTAVSWSVPTLQGSTSAITGPHSATLLGIPTGQRLFLDAAAPSLTFTLETTHGALWQSFWDTSLRAVGLSTAAGHYTLPPPTATSATLVLYGPTTAPASLTNDLKLTLQQSSISIDLRPAG